jgi:hypothetical protein
MGLNLTDAQVKTITEKLFLFKSPSPTLPKPTNTDNASDPKKLGGRMKSVANDPKYYVVSFAVVDFTADRMNPGVFIHKGDIPWRMASAGKIAATLAAAQLRDDVRNVKATGLVTTPADFDELFSTIWSKSRDVRVRQAAGKAGAPRVSTVIDVSKTPPEFFGADVPLNRSGLSGTLLNDWSLMPDHSFRDRLWLMGAVSDNRAATACISEIGVAYMKAVQRAYGLFIDDKKQGMRMLVSSGFSEVNPKTPVSRAAGAPKYRKLLHSEFHWVTDKYGDPQTDPHLSNQPATVKAMTAYMIALIQDKLVSKDGCDAIKAHLADEQTDTQPGSLVRGVNNFTSNGITKAHAKVGVLGPLRCEFAYMEVAGKKYAILAQGLVPFKIGSSFIDADAQGMGLAIAIHKALVAP